MAKVPTFAEVLKHWVKLDCCSVSDLLHNVTGQRHANGEDFSTYLLRVADWLDAQAQAATITTGPQESSGCAVRAQVDDRRAELDAWDFATDEDFSELEKRTGERGRMRFEAACAAMTGLCANPEIINAEIDEGGWSIVERGELESFAREKADALLAEMDKEAK